jgi:predicted AlkP superfamily phosphohydrolase/phosphomutase
VETDRPGQRRIVWMILDGAGYEITSRCIQAGACPRLSTIQEQGYLGSSRPPEPNCETPPALRALFSGCEPRESAVWGYRMPDYRGKLERTVSGF